MEANNQPQEIDIKNIFITIVLFFKRRFKLLFIFGTLGVMLGAVRFFTSPPEYRTNMIALSNVDMWQNDMDNFTTADEVISLLKSIRSDIEEQGYQGIAQKLKMSEADAKKISEFDADYYIPVKPKEEDDVIHKSTYIEISVSVSDNSIIDTLSSALKNYISSNDYIKDKLERRLNAIQSINGKLSREQHAVDSMRGSFYKLRMDDFTILGNQSYSGESVDLFLKQSRYEIVFHELHIFKVISDFSVTEKNHNSLVKNVVIITALFIILGLIIAVLLELITLSKKRT